jgi:hypothetical protein
MRRDRRSDASNPAVAVVGAPRPAAVRAGRQVEHSILLVE